MFGVHCLRKRVPKPACGSHGDFQRDERGSVAVEFALTAIPFFTLLFAIMEAGIIFFASRSINPSMTLHVLCAPVRHRPRARQCNR